MLEESVSCCVVVDRINWYERGDSTDMSMKKMSATGKQNDHMISLSCRMWFAKRVSKRATCTQASASVLN